LIEEFSRQSGFLPGQHAIEAYGRGGFRFGGMSHQGSILALPTRILAWQATSTADIDVEDLAALLNASEPIEGLLIGTGLSALLPNAPFALALKAKGIKLELMDTPAALRTYNLLVSQGRYFGAALIAV
jgi:uncharacterized protein